MPFPYDLLCFDCPRNQNHIIRPSTKWEGKGPILLIDQQTITINYQLPRGKSVFPGSVYFIAYPTDGSGTSYTEAGTFTSYSGSLKGTVTFSTALTEQYAIDAYWVWNDGTTQHITIAVFDTVYSCFPADSEVPCLVNQFQADLCNVDVCSLNCDNTAITVNGTNIGYFDNTGTFIVTNTTYKNGYNIYGVMTSTSMSLSISPGVACDASVQLIVNGDTYSLDTNAPNACGYYV